MDALFGPGAELTRLKAVKQPGQFAAGETVILRGPRGELDRVRVLGPLRARTQVEISQADGIKLGLAVPLRMSGDLDGTPGVELVGPGGSVRLEGGLIVAWRHVHMLPETAARAGFSDGDLAEALIGGERGGVMGNVVVRVAAASALELHIDVEEANAFSLRNGDMARIRKQ
jgi:propanediol utilization protein